MFVLVAFLITSEMYKKYNFFYRNLKNYNFLVQCFVICSESIFKQKCFKSLNKFKRGERICCAFYSV